MPATREIVVTESAPKPIGPYSQGIAVSGTLVFTAGQLGIDPANGGLAGADVREQTRQSIKNVQAILAKAGASLESVVKTTVFLKDMNEFAAMNEVYAEFFGRTSPARSTVEVARLPRDARVEIEAVALVVR